MLNVLQKLMGHLMGIFDHKISRNYWNTQMEEFGLFWHGDFPHFGRRNVGNQSNCDLCFVGHSSAF